VLLRSPQLWQEVTSPLAIKLLLRLEVSRPVHTSHAYDYRRGESRIRLIEGEERGAADFAERAA